ncbi:MAG: lipocalin-like domain-containing protein, partial [Burkholderiales bacterium]
DAYRTEWWYYTGHLTTDSGRRYGFEVTFFSDGVTPPTAATDGPWDLRTISRTGFSGYTPHAETPGKNAGSTHARNVATRNIRTSIMRICC